MSKSGRIKNYNQERGFGFISLEEGGKDIFFHIKDFPKGILPQLGEKLTFKIVQDGHKTKATDIVRLDYPSEKYVYTPPERYSAPSKKAVLNKNNRSKQSSIFSTMVFMVCVAVFAYFAGGYIQGFVQRYKLSNQVVNQQTLDHANRQAMVSDTNNFKCDGRIHCSQMTSKAEADWFVRNCPGTKMDGDGDGDACENDSRW
ncbi:cold shock domain-containing protein [Acinetobacter guerrae]|uniref:cold shock domain-containing protein n=1 Tax=Acinetobacter guerrae TaxID=1843371 RepID=UPI00128C04FA|nr:cold shock domain-containing protein [Acinetobacter guerrae]MPW45314.1 hypothetical protein [Acinetobacter guerrae]